RGNLASALLTYRQALAALSQMPKEVTKLADFQALNAITNESLGDALLQTEDAANKRLALECRSKALEVRGTLAKSQPSVDNITSFGTGYIYVRHVYLAQNNRQNTKEYY